MRISNNFGKQINLYNRSTSITANTQIKAVESKVYKAVPSAAYRAQANINFRGQTTTEPKVIEIVKDSTNLGDKSLLDTAKIMHNAANTFVDDTIKKAKSFEKRAAVVLENALATPDDRVLFDSVETSKDGKTLTVKTPEKIDYTFTKSHLRDDFKLQTVSHPVLGNAKKTYCYLGGFNHLITEAKLKDGTTRKTIQGHFEEGSEVQPRNFELIYTDTKTGEVLGDVLLQY